MALTTSKQKLANLIQAYDQVIEASRSMYDDSDLKDWAINHSNNAQSNRSDVIKKLNDKFTIDYNSSSAKDRIIKEGSKVEVLVNHMDGMKGSEAIVKSYSLPAMLSDITMKDGMKMNGHKWLTNDEVKLK